MDMPQSSSQQLLQKFRFPKGETSIDDRMKVRIDQNIKLMTLEEGDAVWLFQP